MLISLCKLWQTFLLINNYNIYRIEVFTTLCLTNRRHNIMEYQSISVKGAPNGPLSSALKWIIGARRNTCLIIYNQHPYWSLIISYRVRGLHNLTSHNIMGYKSIPIRDTPNGPLSSAFEAHGITLPNFSHRLPCNTSPTYPTSLGKHAHQSYYESCSLATFL